MSKHISKVLGDLLPIGETPENRCVIESFLKRSPISRRIHEKLDDRTFGQRLADGVAAFGGSWTFIMLFALVILSWVTLNS